MRVEILFLSLSQSSVCYYLFGFSFFMSTATTSMFLSLSFCYWLFDDDDDDWINSYRHLVDYKAMRTTQDLFLAALAIDVSSIILDS